jgi:hypothetical protein
MTFQRYAAFFQPHELSALTAAYDAVWQQVRATRGIEAAETSKLEHNLAQIILASACTGERDAERLREIALRAVLGNRRGEGSEPAHQG